MTFILAREFGWSKKDMREFLAHELVVQIKKIQKWHKENRDTPGCPLLKSEHRGR